MNRWKVGRCIYKDYIMEIICNPNEQFKKDQWLVPCLKMIILKKGKIKININNIEVTLMAPYVICLNNHDQIDIISHEGYEAISIYFDPSVLNNALDLKNIYMDKDTAINSVSIMQDKNFFLPFTQRMALYEGTLIIDEFTLRILLNKFERLEDELQSERDVFWPCRSRSYFIEILIILQEKYMDYFRQERCSEEENRVKEVEPIINYIHTHYMKKITINDLTKEFTMNRNKLSKNFVTIMGITPIAYLIRHRLKIAANMLINTRIPIYEICERVGFVEETHFIRSFKKQYGQSPSKYRKENCIID